MNKMLWRAIVVAATVVSWLPVLAHHSFAAEFDANKPITLKGAVTKVEWSNPHAWVFIDVKAAEGKIVNWAVETGGPNALYRKGWKKDSLHVGEEITVRGWRAKDGSASANAKEVMLADGRVLGAASSGETDATKHP
jgi:hypothetical protein